MARPDDCSLTPGQLDRVRKEAERALREAGALGIFPTPIHQIMSVARVEEVTEDVLNPSFIDKLRGLAEGAGQILKKAASKVLGLFHASAGLVYLDQTLHAVKKRFIRLHEAAHGFMPWQRKMYAVVEDCEHALDPHAADLFDREANVFASEVLFQLDTFRDMADGMAFSIFTPVKLAKQFDASLYSAIRQYVAKNHRTCAVVVMNMPELVPGVGFRATLRRAVQSETFTAQFGNHPWPEAYTPDDDIGAFIPLGTRRASGKRQFVLVDRNGQRHECIGEAFTQKHQVFVLIHPQRTLSSPRLISNPFAEARNGP